MSSVVSGWLRECDADDDGRISRDEFAKLGPRLNLQAVVVRMLPEVPVGVGGSDGEAMAGDEGPAGAPSGDG